MVGLVWRLRTAALAGLVLSLRAAAFVGLLRCLRTSALALLILALRAAALVSLLRGLRVAALAGLVLALRIAALIGLRAIVPHAWLPGFLRLTFIAGIWLPLFLGLGGRGGWCDRRKSDALCEFVHIPVGRERQHDENGERDRGGDRRAEANEPHDRLATPGKPRSRSMRGELPCVRRPEVIQRRKHGYGKRRLETQSAIARFLLSQVRTRRQCRMPPARLRQRRRHERDKRRPCCPSRAEKAHRNVNQCYGGQEGKKQADRRGPEDPLCCQPACQQYRCCSGMPAKQPKARGEAEETNTARTDVVSRACALCEPRRNHQSCKCGGAQDEQDSENPG